jgi:predicted metalloprotease with PDZ domain
VDAPTMLGVFDLFRFDVDGTPHFFVEKLSAPVSADTVAAATAKFAKMVRTQRAIFGSLPYEKYLVFYLPDTCESNAQGALEHANAYVDATGPMKKLPAPNAHEFFHAWNVKRIRPAEMWPYDYARPNESPSLWVSEGITSYYGDVSPLRAGFTGDSIFLSHLDGAVNLVELTDARRYFSPSDASISTWLGYDTNVAFSVSYYAQGHVLGALLDLSILHDTHGTRRLDDVMRALYAQYYLKGKGFTPDDMRRTVSAVAGRDYTDFFRRYVAGVDVPPYDSIFAYAGYERGAVGYLGIFGQSTPQGYLIQGMMRGSAAAVGGLKFGDILVSNDGMPVRPGAGGMGAGAPGQRIKYVVLRNGKEQQIEVTLATRLVLRSMSASSISAEQRLLRDRWLARIEPAAPAR